MGRLRFKRDTSFRKQFFVPDSFAHPAKMDAQLLVWIVERYTEAGETILDPMAGSGTLMLACTMARNVVMVELEEKFCKMMRDNWAEVRMRPQLGSAMGDCQIIQGDARQLDGLLCDKIITSPPYSDMSMGGGLNTKPPRDGHNDQSGRSYKSPSQKGAGGYVDKIVTSPSFGGAEASDDRKTFNDTHHNIGQGSLKTHHYSKDNIGNLPYGNIDSIITSPPYEGSLEGGSRHTQGGIPSRDKKLGQTGTYETIDSIITSPPYERSLHETGSDEFKQKKAEYAEKHLGGASRTSLIMQHSGEQKSPDNIGNLKSQSYLEAMLQVYKECWKCLKPQGLMILITKNFIRNKEVTRLDTDTIKLCEQVGFKFIERHYRQLPSQSFWRIIYHQKYPDVEQIHNEDVLVFKKDNEAHLPGALDNQLHPLKERDNE